MADAQGGMIDAALKVLSDAPKEALSAEHKSALEGLAKKLASGGAQSLTEAEKEAIAKNPGLASGALKGIWGVAKRNPKTAILATALAGFMAYKGITNFSEVKEEIEEVKDKGEALFGGMKGIAGALGQGMMGFMVNLIGLFNPEAAREIKKTMLAEDMINAAHLDGSDPDAVRKMDITAEKHGFADAGQMHWAAARIEDGGIQVNTSGEMKFLMGKAGEWAQKSGVQTPPGTDVTRMFVQEERKQFKQQGGKDYTGHQIALKLGYQEPPDTQKFGFGQLFGSIFGGLSEQDNTNTKPATALASAPAANAAKDPSKPQPQNPATRNVTNPVPSATLSSAPAPVVQNVYSRSGHYRAAMPSGVPAHGPVVPGVPAVVLKSSPDDPGLVLHATGASHNVVDGKAHISRNDFNYEGRKEGPNGHWEKVKFQHSEFVQDHLDRAGNVVPKKIGSRDKLNGQVIGTQGETPDTGNGQKVKNGLKKVTPAGAVIVIH